MNEPVTLRFRWAAVSAIVAGAGFILAFGSGWVAAVRTDAALKQRVETHLDESKHYGSDISDLKTAVAVNGEQIKALTELMKSAQESDKRLTDKIDLLIQSQMREGRIQR